SSRSSSPCAAGSRDTRDGGSGFDRGSTNCVIGSNKAKSPRRGAASPRGTHFCRRAMESGLIKQPRLSPPLPAVCTATHSRTGLIELPARLGVRLGDPVGRSLGGLIRPEG